MKLCVAIRWFALQNTAMSPLNVVRTWLQTCLLLLFVSLSCDFSAYMWYSIQRCLFFLSDNWSSENRLLSSQSSWSFAPPLFSSRIFASPSHRPPPISDRRHVDWVRSYLSIWTEMQAFIKQHHTVGLVWSKTVSTTCICSFVKHFIIITVTPSSYKNKKYVCTFGHRLAWKQ